MFNQLRQRFNNASRNVSREYHIFLHPDPTPRKVAYVDPVMGPQDMGSSEGNQAMGFANQVAEWWHSKTEETSRFLELQKAGYSITPDGRYYAMIECTSAAMNEIRQAFSTQIASVEEGAPVKSLLALVGHVVFNCPPSLNR